MTKAEKEIQQIETELRMSLTNSYEIINILFPEVLKKNIYNAKIQFNYGLCVRLQSGIMTLLPYAYYLSSYLNGKLTLGAMMSQAAIFSLLVVNMSIIVSMYPRLMQAIASKERINELV